MEIMITIKIDGEDVKVSTEMFESNKKGLEDKGVDNVSQYAKWFNDYCVGWTKDPEFNLQFLQIQQRYLNDKLRKVGHVFLNDVYDCLGIQRTRAGAIVGWTYNKEHPNGDNFVDFGLNDERNIDFINGNTNKVLLDFNVDGSIIDLIE